MVGIELEISIDDKNLIRWISNFNVYIWECGVVETPMGMGSWVGSLIDNSIGKPMGQCNKVKITNVLLLGHVYSPWIITSAQ